MFRPSVLAIALCATASPAIAGHCNQPYAPSVAVSASNTEKQILQMRDDVQAFIEASDVYQQCLADSAKSDPSLGTKVTALLTASQQDKVRAGEAINAVVKAFNAAKAGVIKTTDARN